jgi:hypothetical protein
MFRFLLTLASRARPKRRRPDTRRLVGFRPSLEACEERTLPAAVSWISASSGSWDTASNWSTGNVPGANDDATINKPGVTVTVNGNPMNAGFDIVHSLTSTDPLVLGTGAALVVDSTSTLSAALTLNPNSALNCEGGTLTLAATTNNGSLHALGGSIALDGAVTGTGTMLGVITPSPLPFLQNGVSISGNTIGAVLEYSNSANNVLSGVTIDNGAIVQAAASPGKERISGSLTLDGTIDVNGGSTLGFGVAANEHITVNGNGVVGSIDFDANAGNAISLDNGVQLTLNRVHIFGKNNLAGAVQCAIGTEHFAVPTGSLTLGQDSEIDDLNINPTTFTVTGTPFGAAGGTLQVIKGDTMKVTAATFTNFSNNKLTNGRYQVGGTLTFPGAHIVTNAADLEFITPGAAIQDQNGNNALAAFTTNTATLRVDNGTTLALPGNFTNQGGLVTLGTQGLSNPALTTIGHLTLGGNYVEAGTAILSTGSTLTVAASKTVQNSGEIQGTGTVSGNVVNSGTVAPGTPNLHAGKLGIGTLNITGNYTQTGSGSLSLEIAGNVTPGTDYDTLSISGSAALGGNISVALDSFQPLAGDSYQVLSFASSSGDFSKQTGFAVGNGLVLKEQNTGAKLNLLAQAGGSPGGSTGTPPSPPPGTVPSNPNNTIPTALPLGDATQAPVSTNGVIVNPTDVQMFSFTVAAGETVLFQITSDPFDSVVRLFDGGGTQLALASPLTLAGGSASFTYRFAAAGTYFAGVSGYPNYHYNPLDGSGTIPGATGAFTLTLIPNPPPQNDPYAQISTARSLGAANQVHVLSNFWIPAPTDVDLFRFTVTAHQQITIIIGRPAGSTFASLLRLFNARGQQLAVSSGGPDAMLSFKFAAGGTYYVGVSGRGNGSYNAVTGGGARAGSTGSFSIALIPGVPGQAARRLDEATNVGMLGHGARTVSGVVHGADIDLFSFNVADGQRVAFAVTGRGNFKPYLRLFDGNGVELANNGSSGRLQFTFLVGETYYLGVSVPGNRTYDAVTGTGSTAGSSASGAFLLNATPQGMQSTPFSAGPGAQPSLWPYDAPVAGVAGVVQFDQSGTGRLLTGAVGESGHMVFFDSNNNGIRDDGEPATVTNAQGQFLLDGHPGSVPVFAAPLTQFGIAIEKVTVPPQGYYSAPLTGHKAVVHLTFGMSRLEA